MSKKNTMFKMKNTVHGINGRLNIAEEKVSELEYIAVETIQMKQTKKEYIKRL